MSITVGDMIKKLSEFDPETIISIHIDNAMFNDDFDLEILECVLDVGLSDLDTEEEKIGVNTDSFFAVMINKYKNNKREKRLVIW